MLPVLLIHLGYRIIALEATVNAVHFLTTSYVEALIEIARAYLTIIYLLYSRDRLPLRL
jgi:hypothetical protein